MAATWKVTSKGNSFQARYTGDLKEALEKAETDFKKYINDRNIEKWVWLKEKAEAEIKANERAKERAAIFIRLAKAELEKQEAENG